MDIYFLNHDNTDNYLLGSRTELVILIVYINILRNQ